jgi:hypothetical protein
MTGRSGNQRVGIDDLKAHRSTSRGEQPSRGLPFLVLLSAASLFQAGCHSYHVDATVENRTGAPIQLLEIDYPSASFGRDKLATGELFNYRIQLQGSGPLKVHYTTADRHQVDINGPTVRERQEGALRIVLVPEGKAEFHLEIEPSHR